MNFTIEEIQAAAFKTGLSKNIVQSLIDNLPHKRSSQQNKSLHLLFQNMAFELNRIGKEFTYNGIKGMEISTTYTPEIVKEFIWKKLQQSLYGKDSTTKLTTQDIDAIFLILGKWFSEQGIIIDFPSAEII